MRRSPGGELVLAHDPAEARTASALRFSAALERLRTGARPGTELLIDLKEPDTAPAIAAALKGAGLAARTLVCCGGPDVMHRLAADHPELRRAWSFESVRQAAAARLAWPRYSFARQAAAAVALGLAEAVSVRRALVRPRLVRAVHRAGGRVYAWDVTGAGQARRLSARGVDGLIGDDPRLLREASRSRGRASA